MSNPRPAVPNPFATGPNYPAGADPWSGTPVRVEPGAGDRATGLIPGTRPPAQWLNFDLGLGFDWDVYLANIIDTNEEHTYSTAKARVVTLGLGGAMPSNDADPDCWTYLGGTTPRWQTHAVDAGSLVLPLDPYLRTGQTVTGFQAAVKPGAARAGAARMSASLVYMVTDYAVPANNPVAGSVVTQIFDDTTANKQTLTSGALGMVIDRSLIEYFLVIKGGNTSNAFPDTLYGIHLSITDIGPRNA